MIVSVYSEMSPGCLEKRFLDICSGFGTFTGVILQVKNISNKKSMQFIENANELTVMMLDYH